MGVGPTKFGRKSTPLALSIFQVTVSRVKWLHCSNWFYTKTASNIQLQCKLSICQKCWETFKPC